MSQEITVEEAEALASVVDHLEAILSYTTSTVVAGHAEAAIAAIAVVAFEEA